MLLSKELIRLVSCSLKDTWAIWSELQREQLLDFLVSSTFSISPTFSISLILQLSYLKTYHLAVQSTQITGCASCNSNFKRQLRKMLIHCISLRIPMKKANADCRKNRNERLNIFTSSWILSEFIGEDYRDIEIRIPDYAFSSWFDFFSYLYSIAICNLVLFLILGNFKGWVPMVICFHPCSVHTLFKNFSNVWIILWKCWIEFQLSGRWWCIKSSLVLAVRKEGSFV